MAHDPLFNFRLPLEDRAVLERVAEAEGRSLSAIARDALRRYLDERADAEELTGTAA